MALGNANGNTVGKTFTATNNRPNNFSSVAVPAIPVAAGRLAALR